MPKTKRKPKNPSLHSDFGPRERRQHGPLVVERVPADMTSTTNRDRIRAIEIDDPLYQYKRNKSIDGVQREAGLRLRGLWEKTGLEPSVTSAYQEMIAAGSVQSLRIASIDHYQKYVTAVRAVGPIASNEIVSVCCLQEFIRSAHMEILRRGLDLLAKHFGLRG